MTDAGRRAFDDDAPEADAAEQLIPVDVDDEDDEDTWRDAAQVANARDWDASEADLIDQAIEVPTDDSEFDR